MASLSKEDVQEMFDRSPFIHLLGLRVIELDVDAKTIEVLMPFSNQAERKAESGQIHGGAIAALIDTAGTFAVMACVGEGVPTINIRIDFLRPAINSDLMATATVKRLGRTISTVDVDVHDQAGKLIALGRGTFGTSSG